MTVNTLLNTYFIGDSMGFNNINTYLFNIIDSIEITNLSCCTIDICYNNISSINNIITEK